MQITGVMDAELRALGNLAGVPELSPAVHDLLALCVTAVPSCTAARVTSPALGPGHAIETRGLAAAHGTAQASLRLDLRGARRGVPPHPIMMSVLMLATQPGAFADFVGGADPLNRQGFRIVRRSVDEDLQAATDQAALNGRLPLPTEDEAARPENLVLHARIVNRALGVLIDRGHPPDSALRALHDLAHSAGFTLLNQACAVLDSIPPKDA